MTRIGLISLAIFMVLGVAANAQSDKKTVVKFSHWWSYVTEDSLKDFKAANPEISIDMEYIAYDAYANKIKLLAASNNLPDLFGVAAPTLAELIKKNAALDLTGALATKSYDKAANWGATQTPSLMDNMRVGVDSANGAKVNGTFSMPFGAVTVAVVYNKSVFAKLGIKKPATFSEFLTNNDKLKSAGYVPMSMVGKFGWGSWWYRIAASQYMPDVTTEDFMTGKAKFTDPGFVSSLKVVQDMWKRGHFDQGGFINGAEETQALFVQQKLAQYLVVPENFVTYLLNNVPKGVELDAYVLPPMTGTKNLAIGGSSNLISVSAKSSSQEAAIKLAKYLTSERYYQKLAGDGVVPSTSGYVPPAGNTVMKAYADAMAQGFFVDNTPASANAKLNDKMEKDLLPRLMMKQESAEKIAAELQAELNKIIKK